MMNIVITSRTFVVVFGVVRLKNFDNFMKITWHMQKKISNHCCYLEITLILK